MYLTYLELSLSVETELRDTDRKRGMWGREGGAGNGAGRDTARTLEVYIIYTWA